jgi:hypothetical protein
MSKTDYIVQLITNEGLDNGMIEQSFYDFLIDSVTEYFEISKGQARKTVMETLRELYLVKA